MRAFLVRYAYWVAAAVLALGMEAVLYAFTRDAGLTAGQYGAVAGATALLAGLCVWIFTWE